MIFQFVIVILIDVLMKFDDLELFVHVFFFVILSDFLMNSDDFE